MMLAQRLGFCFDCHSTFYMDYDDLDEYGDPKKKPIKPMMYTDIATDHEYSSANTAHKKMRKGTYEIKRSHKRHDITKKAPLGMQNLLRSQRG